MAADSCCAGSESDGSTPSPVPAAAGITIAVLQPAVTGFEYPLATPAFGWHPLHPLPASPVPKYLLLSVLLV